MKKALSLFLAVLMAMSAFAGLSFTAAADSYGRVSRIWIKEVVAPSVGAKPEYTAIMDDSRFVQTSVDPMNNYEEGMYDGIAWYDVTDQKVMKSTDTYKAGHQYSVTILVISNNDLRFAENDIPDTVTINGNDAQIAYYYNSDSSFNNRHVYVIYTFDALPKGWTKYNNSYWVYYQEDGAATGWLKLGGVWYYFNENGVMQTGWQKIGGSWYYFKSSGAMATGWQKIGGVWYYFKSSGAMATGWQKIGGVWYYFKSSGAMVTGWQKISGKWYYFETSGKMRTANLTYKGKVYKFNSSGACINP